MFGQLLGFLLVVSFIGWGSAFAFLHFRREAKNLDQGMDNQVLGRLLEDVDQLTSRLSRVEEELDFYRELRGTEAPERLAPPDPDPAQEGS